MIWMTLALVTLAQNTLEAEHQQEQEQEQNKSTQQNTAANPS